MDETPLQKLSHINESGKAHMVDISPKPRVRRSARAQGFVRMSSATIRAIRENNLAKGDVLATARIAGIMAAKKTSDLIPLCHPIEIEQVVVDFNLREEGVHIEARCLCTDKTGIEMEALTAVSVAALTIYDMCKAIDTSMKIEHIFLTEKTKETSDGI
ncbi:MAG: cyclic pyranopterin monophosphate synthase MoaC [Treponemataceae bacterium]|nr:cyclic pyranopterin monophosphate synthase MoaC [Treponemataceae bacterium]